MVCCISKSNIFLGKGTSTNSRICFGTCQNKNQIKKKIPNSTLRYLYQKNTVESWVRITHPTIGVYSRIFLLLFWWQYSGYSSPEPPKIFKNKFTYMILGCGIRTQLSNSQYKNLHICTQFCQMFSWNKVGCTLRTQLFLSK